ncbi:MAG TPA: hypothetical protein VGC53_19660 [Vicinamibacteria bacterium]
MNASSILARSRLDLPPKKPLGHGEWCRVAVYVNEVVVAAHLQLGKHKPGEAKESLRLHLRRLRNLAWDQGHLRPIVAVLDVQAEHRLDVEQWAGDQDWHRGEFVLFVATAEEVNSTLIDLLGPQPDPWKSKEVVRQRTVEEVLRELESLVSDSIVSHIDGAAAAYRGIVRSVADVAQPKAADLVMLQADAAKAMDSRLGEWFYDIEAKAIEAFHQAGGNE